MCFCTLPLFSTLILEKPMAGWWVEGRKSWGVEEGGSWPSLFWFCRAPAWNGSAGGRKDALVSNDFGVFIIVISLGKCYSFHDFHLESPSLPQTDQECKRSSLRWLHREGVKDRWEEFKNCFVIVPYHIPLVQGTNYGPIVASFSWKNNENIGCAPSELFPFYMQMPLLANVSFESELLNWNY